jgi:hypothetical protein
MHYTYVLSSEKDETSGNGTSDRAPTHGALRLGGLCWNLLAGLLPWCGPPPGLG